jgi:magnesium-transporting ATPase (P-type)
MRLLLLSNALVGFWEEYEAGNAIAALKTKLAVNVRVNGIRRKASTQRIQLSQ